MFLDEGNCPPTRTRTISALLRRWFIFQRRNIGVPAYDQSCAIQNAPHYPLSGIPQSRAMAYSRIGIRLSSVVCYPHGSHLETSLRPWAGMYSAGTQVRASADSSAAFSRTGASGLRREQRCLSVMGSNSSSGVTTIVEADPAVILCFFRSRSTHCPLLASAVIAIGEPDRFRPAAVPMPC